VAGPSLGWQFPAAAAGPILDSVERPAIDKSRAARSVVWSLVENGGLALVSFTSLIIYSRFLSAAEFGVFSIALAVVELLNVVVSMLFHDALVQREHASSLHFDTAFSVTLALSVVLFASTVLLAPAFARVMGNPAAAPVLCWTAGCIPATAISSTLVAQHRRELAFKALALRSLVGRLSGALVGIVLVMLGAGLWGLVAQQLLIALIGSLVLWLRASTRLRLRFGAAELRQLLGFGASALSVLFLTFAIKRVFVIVAGVGLGSEAAGYLNLSFRAIDVLWAIAATAVTQVALPVLARLQSDKERLKAAYRASNELTCLVLYPCFVGIAVVAPEAIELLFGRQWLPSTPYVVVLGFLVLLQAPRLLITPMLTALGRPRDSLPGIAVEMLVMLGLLLTLDVRSLPVAVGIWALREVLSMPVKAVVLQRAAGIGLFEQLRGTGMPFVASLAMAGAVYSVRESLPLQMAPALRLLLLVSVGAAVFLLCAWLLGRSSLRVAYDFVASAASRGRQ
jgi:PST family polysaccharide transporter